MTAMQDQVEERTPLQKNKLERNKSLFSMAVLYSVPNLTSTQSFIVEFTRVGME